MRYFFLSPAAENFRLQNRSMAQISLVIRVVSLLIHSPWQTEQKTTRMQEVFNWKWIDYRFSNDTHRQKMIESGRFVPGNSIPTSIALWTTKMFITTPRFKPGVPVTLSYIHTNTTDNITASPLLIPYPSWEGHDLLERNVTSAQNVYVDPCDRLWTLDSGQIEYKRETDPALLVYDLRTDRLAQTHKIKAKSGDYKAEPFFSDLAVDVTSSSCDHAYAYMADANNQEITIFALRTLEFYKITHNYFHFDPLAGDLLVDDVHYQTQYGVFSIAMSPVGRDDFRMMFFTPLASNTQFSVSTRVLQNRTLDAAKSYYEFKVVGSRGTNAQSSASTFDEETGVLFYTLIAKNAIGCWNSFSGDEYDEKTQGIIVDDNNFIYPTDVEVDKQGMLWAIFNRLPKFKLGLLNNEEINIRVLRGNIRSLIKGTVCDAV